MSLEQVAFFYARLDADPVLKAEALGLKEHYAEQEDLIRAFLKLAEREGFSFTEADFLQFLLRKS